MNVVIFYLKLSYNLTHFQQRTRQKQKISAQKTAKNSQRLQRQEEMTKFGQKVSVRGQLTKNNLSFPNQCKILDFWKFFQIFLIFTASLGHMSGKKAKKKRKKRAK
jgi:hypothetical protein